MDGWMDAALDDRLTLHARSLSMVGFGGEPLSFEAPYPRDIEIALKNLRKWRKPPRR